MAEICLVEAPPLRLDLVLRAAKCHQLLGSQISGGRHKPYVQGGASRDRLDGHGIGHEAVLMLNDDLSIIEAVDSEGRYIRPGVRSAKIFITNLFNQVLPLIRLEVTDENTFLETSDPRGSGHRMIAEVEGRMDEIFIYNEGKYIVHPPVFRSVLGSERSRIV